MGADLVIFVCLLLIAMAILSPMIWSDAEDRIRSWLVVSVFAVAAAIVFHAWWPSYKAEQDLEAYAADCLEDSDKFRNVCIKEYYFIYSDRIR